MLLCKCQALSQKSCVICKQADLMGNDIHYESLAVITWENSPFSVVSGGISGSSETYVTELASLSWSHKHTVRVTHLNQLHLKYQSSVCTYLSALFSSTTKGFFAPLAGCASHGSEWEAVNHGDKWEEKECWWDAEKRAGTGRGRDPGWDESGARDGGLGEAGGLRHWRWGGAGLHSPDLRLP